MKITDEILPWVWAINEQLILLDRHDAFWIKQAASNWPLSNGWSAKNRKVRSWSLDVFLSSYSLRRGYAASLFKSKEGMLYFRDLCHKEFSKPLSVENYRRESEERWNYVVNKISESKEVHKFLPDNKESTSFNLWSATLKMYWFYQPEKLPMFDTYTKSGIIKELELRAIKNDNYLSLVYKFYDERASGLIPKAQKYVSRNYPYKLRIVDKFLWLVGNPKKNSILNAFKEGLELSPLTKSGSDQP